MTKKEFSESEKQLANLKKEYGRYKKEVKQLKNMIECKYPHDKQLQKSYSEKFDSKIIDFQKELKRLSGILERKTYVMKNRILLDLDSDLNTFKNEIRRARRNVTRIKTKLKL